MSDDHEPKCGFCKLTSAKVNKLIRGASSDAFICDACVMDCAELIEEHAALDIQENRKKGTGKPKPSEIVKHLDQSVISQVDAKKTLAVAVYNHYKRIGKNTAVEIGKANVLLVGPTGSGKTYLVETIARFLDVPFAIADATGMTEAGYVGDDVESVLVRLVQNAGGDIQKAERGIIYIDEIDKIATRGGSTRDVSGEGVQQGLLKMLEGNLVTINLNGKKNAQGPQETIDTKDILFICGGAFSALTDHENNQPKALGIISNKEELALQAKKKLTPRDLIKFGMIPEFVGRFPLLAQLNPLSEEDMIKILKDTKNSLLKQYQELLSLDGVNVSFTEDFLLEVAKRAKSEGTGARGLRGILEPIMTKIMYWVPDSENTEHVDVTKDMIEDEEKK